VDVAKDSKGKVAEEVPEQYGDVVQRLEEVVARLEGGSLSLEDSLKAFEAGIKLVRRGEQLLNAAENRIEELLREDGRDVVAPLQAGVKSPAPPSSPEPAPASRGSQRTSKAPLPPEDDVPF
jgi:exodeoxyribonuclease VII small subunit